MTDSLDRIAVVGMAGRYPGAQDLHQFWQNLKEGKECISFYTAEDLTEAGVDPALVARANYVRAQGSCTGTYLFDAGFFGYSPREAELLDPQHRVFLECAWEALEHAACEPWSYPGRIGVFAGAGPTQYLFELLSMPEIWKSTNEFAISTYADRDFLATRVGYKMNLRGPCITVQTACSTSLVAIVLACQSLLNFQTDVALAGGVRLNMQELSGYLYHEGGVLSPDGHCRTFDAEAKGTVGSAGCGVVVLKRLDDALADGDTIHAVVLGTGLNNDGAAKVGYAAPGLDGQVAVVSDAIAVAGINPESIGFVECHGTATPMGDPIEIAALTRAFRAHTPRKQFCAAGSVKSNIGHTDTASGVAGFTKAVLAIKHKLIPATVNFHKPNPEIDFASSPFFVNKESLEWKAASHPRRAAVSALGLGGTNAHVILEEAPGAETLPSNQPWELLVWSARSASALKKMEANLVGHLNENQDIQLADIAYTLQVGRRGLSHRSMLVCRNQQDAVQDLESSSSEKVFTAYREGPAGPVTFLFPGQGPQHIQMGRELYLHQPVFRDQIDHCADYLKSELGIDLREVLYPPDGKASEAASLLDQIQYTTPILFSMEYALAKLWMDWGIKPEALIGHSTGEYVAACIAGVFTLQDALHLVSTRGRLMQQLPAGAMMGVMLPEAEVRPLLGSGTSLAVINGPSACVVSGTPAAISEMEAKLVEKSVPCRRLHISHASHSEMMDPILMDFRREVARVTLNSPQIPYISNLSGTWIKDFEVRNPDYWVKHLRHTVRFADGISELLKDGKRILLEVGPGRMLSSLVAQHPNRGEEHVVLSSLPHPKNDPQTDLEFFLTTAGQLWLEGITVNWNAIRGSERRRRVPLPTYPFEREYYRLTPQRGSNLVAQLQSDAEKRETARKVENVPVEDANGIQRRSRHGGKHRRPNLTTPYVPAGSDLECAIASVWEDTLGIENPGVNDSYVALGGDSLLAIQMAARISDSLGIDFPVGTFYQAPTIAGIARSATTILSKRPAASPGTLRVSAVNGEPENSGYTKQLFLPSPGDGIVPKEVKTNGPANGSREWHPSAGDSALVTIREHGSKLPLFLVHPVGGGVMAYYDLARHLDPEQPVHALQNQDPVSRDHSVCRSIEEMATRYIHAVQKVQPSGPYVLGGSSMGGMVAIEMAQQLTTLNHEVALVVMMDTAARIAMPREKNEAAKSRRAGELILLSKVMGAPEGKELYVAQEELERLQPDEQIDYFFDKMRLQEFVPPQIDASVFRRAFVTFSNNLRALENYTPRSYTGRLAVLRASEVLEEAKALARDLYEDPSFGWQELCAQPVEVHFVSGDHVRMNLEPHVRQLAAKTQLCIDHATKSCRPASSGAVNVSPNDVQTKDFSTIEI